MEEEEHEEGVIRQNEVYKKSGGATISGYPFTGCQLLIKPVKRTLGLRFEHLESHRRYDDVSGQVLLRADGVRGEAGEGSGEPYSLSLQCLQDLFRLNVHDESDYPEGEFQAHQW